MEHNEDDEWRQKNVWNIGIAEKGKKRAADRELLPDAWEQLKDNRKIII